MKCKRFWIEVAILVAIVLLYVVATGGRGEPDPTTSDLETHAPACYYGVAYPWAGSLWNRSSRDMKMQGGVHIGNNEYRTRIYTLGPGQDSRNTDMCDVDHVKHDISLPDKWRYFLVDKNVGDWAKVSIARVICSDPPSHQTDQYGVKCG